MALSRAISGENRRAATEICAGNAMAENNTAYSPNPTNAAQKTIAATKTGEKKRTTASF